MFTLNIKTDILKTLNQFASTDETRFIINGVHVEASRGSRLLLVATDGRRIVVFEIAEPVVDDFEFTIPSAFIEALPAESETELVYGPETGEIQAKFSRHVIQAVSLETGANGKYPKWRQVVPSPWPKTFGNRNLAVNMGLLAEVCAAAEKLVGVGVTITSNGDDRDPVCIRRHGFTAVVMPLHKSGESQPPDFTL